MQAAGPALLIRRWILKKEFATAVLVVCLVKERDYHTK